MLGNQKKQDNVFLQRRHTGPTNRNRRSGSGGSGSGGDSPQWHKASKTLIFWLVMIIIVLIISQKMNVLRSPVAMVKFHTFVVLLKNNQVRSGTIKGQVFEGEVKTPQASELDGQITYTRFKVNLPSDITFETTQKWIEEYGVQIDVKQDSPGLWNVLINTAPWLLLIFVWLYFIRRLQAGAPKGIFSFGRSRAKLLTENHPKVTFDDVAGADEAKQELREIIEFLKEPEKFQRLGGKIPKGALLLGPPGTGKTLLAKAVAGEAGVPFFSMSGADFVEMFVGVGASRVRDLFEQGKKNAPCIIFIDEVDAVGRHRGAGLGGGHDEREQTLNQLLVEMDGFDSNEGVILIAATNRPDVLDHALLRPGRFDRRIVVDRPDVRGREGILRVHTKKIPIAKNVDFEVVARGTPGFSGADIANMVNEAALLAARKNKIMVDSNDLEEARDKVMMGVERKSLLITEEEKRATAFHEAGHALVTKLIPGADPVHKITIIPRGRALGLTTFLPVDEKYNYSKENCESQIRGLLGGRAAEIVVLNQLTTGAGDDIKRATELARKMVCEWGMSDRIGPLTFGEKQEEIFLGREIAQHRDYSERTARIIDEEVKRIVTNAANDVEKLLRENTEHLHNIAIVLLEREILTGDEIDQIISGKTLAPLASNLENNEDNSSFKKPIKKKQTSESPEFN